MGCVDPFKTDAYSFGVTLEVMLLGENCAELSIDDDGKARLLPRRCQSNECTKLLDAQLQAEQISPEAFMLLQSLLQFQPVKRSRLTDNGIRNHPFFLTTLNCKDLATNLMPPPSP